MATSPIPRPIAPKTSSFTNETSSATMFSDLLRFFQPKILKVSKQSPPVLNVDVKEGEIVWDRTASRLYTVSNQALRYVQFT